MEFCNDCVQYGFKAHRNLKKKVKVIKTAEKNQGMSIRELAEQFDCGRTQIAKMFKDKESILSLY